jgi:hypothetical protein
MEYAIVNDGNVVNMIEWDGEAYMPLPEGDTAVLATDDAAMGGTYNGSDFTLPAVDPILPNPLTAAWAEAQVEWISNGTVVADEPLQRCIEQGTMDNMTGPCMQALLIAYPQV